MNTINDTQNRINLSANNLQEAASTTSAGNQLEKADFMNLFMYQLSNQNPLDPMDSSKMMSSLAELGSMEQLQFLNKELKNIATAQKDLVQLSALNYLNRDVQVLSNVMSLAGDGTGSIDYKLSSPSYNTKANVINQDGQVIKQINLGSQPQGVYTLKWDGVDTTGKRSPSGDYKVKIMAYDEKGKQVEASLIKAEKVSQVKFENGQPLLKVGEQFIALSDALSIEDKK